MMRYILQLASLAWLAILVEHVHAARHRVALDDELSVRGKYERANVTVGVKSNQMVLVGAHLVEQGTIIGGRFRLTSMLWPQAFDPAYNDNKQLRSYSNRDFLGAGQYGAAYKAHDEKTNTNVVVKLFFKSADDKSLLTKAGADTDAAQQRLALAERECQAAVLIQENLAFPEGQARWMKCLYDGMDDPRAAHVVYEFLGRTNLRQYIELVEEGDSDTKALGKADMLRLTKQLLEGLKQVQGQFVHRDIKAENVMIEIDDNSLLPDIHYIDFGFVVAESDATASSAGSPITRAPESFAPGYVPTSKFDVYSVGAMLYDVFCGSHLINALLDDVQAHDSNAGTEQAMSFNDALKQTIELIAQDRVDIPSYCENAFDYGIPAEMQELFEYVVTNMMEPDPAKRRDAVSMLGDTIFEGVATFDQRFRDHSSQIDAFMKLGQIKELSKPLAKANFNVPVSDFTPSMARRAQKKSEHAFFLNNAKTVKGGQTVVMYKGKKAGRHQMKD